MLRRLLIAVVAVFAAQGAFAVVALRVGHGADSLQECRGQLWGVAESALWRLENDQMKKVFQYREAVGGELLVANEEVWFLTDHVLFRVDGDTAHRVSEGVDSFAADADGIVIRRGEELLRLENGRERLLGRVDARTGAGLETAGGRVWVVGERTDLIEKNSLRNVALERSYIRDVRGRAFVFGRGKNFQGLYRLEKDGHLTLLTAHEFTGEVVDTGDEIWFESGDGVVWMKDVAGPATVSLGGSFLGRSNGRTWLWNADRNEVDVIAENGTRSAVVQKRRTYRATEHAGIFYYADSYKVHARQGTRDVEIVEIYDRAYAEGEEDSTVKALRTWKGHVYAAGDSGAYEIDGLSARQLTDDNIDKVFVAGGHLWLSGFGLYRIDEDVDIVPEIVSSDSWWKRIFNELVPGAIPAGIIQVRPRYARRSDGRDPYARDVPRSFDTALSLEEKTYEFKSAENNILDVGPGVHTLHIAVRDKSGNVFAYWKRIKVIPGPLAASVALWIAGALGVGLVLLLAPWVSWCQSLVLNPFVQKYATFGSLKLILSIVPAARRHLMRRYRIELRKDLNASAKLFVMPSPQLEPQQIAAALQTHRRLLIKGQSGIGKTACLRYLAWHAAQGKFPEHAIPIFVPVARYRGRPIMDTIAAQLAAYGHISDRNSELLSWFIEEGPFLILFDGLNEVDAQTRQNIRVFIDRHWKRNYFVIASQEAYEFDDLSSISLLPLGEPEIRSFLISRLGARVTASTMDQVIAYRDVYGIAQNLEFVIDLIAEGRNIPATAEELCAAVLDPVVKSSVDGGIDFTQPLAMRAFEMIRTREIYVDSDDVNLPAGVLSELRKRKLVVQRDDKMYFSHNLVRDFLAARYLRSNWKDVIPAQAIDTDWRATLDLLARSLDGADLHALLHIVLEKNQAVAGDLFRSTPSERRAGWGQSFELEYGRAVLTSVHS